MDRQECYGNEEGLHRDTEPQLCRRLASKAYASARRMNVGRQNRQEKRDQRIGGRPAKFGEQKADRSRDFTHAGEIDHHAWPRNRGRYHASEIFLHECEMGHACENEHKAQRITRRCLPSDKSGYTCETESPTGRRGRGLAGRPRDPPSSYSFVSISVLDHKAMCV